MDRSEGNRTRVRNPANIEANPYASRIVEQIDIELNYNRPNVLKDCNMAIHSTTFGRVELSGKDAERFQRHMTEDKPNPAAKASLARGREMLQRMAVPVQPISNKQ